MTVTQQSPQPVTVGPPSAQSEEEALAALDRISAGLVEMATPQRVLVADSQEQREAVYRLRYRVMLDEGWGRPENFPGGMESDEYDGRAFHAMVWDGNEAIACSRLVFPEPGLLLPTEEACGMQIEPRGRVVDGGRTAVLREYRGRQRILLAVLGASFQEFRARGGYSFIASMLTPGMIRLYRHVGMEASILGPPRLHLGAERQPVLFDITQISRGIGQRFRHLIDQP